MIHPSIILAMMSNNPNDQSNDITRTSSTTRVTENEQDARETASIAEDVEVARENMELAVERAVVVTVWDQCA